jgi:hypothetical protein
MKVCRSASSENWKPRTKNGWISRVTAMDTAAPHVKAKNRRRFGSGSHLSMTWTVRRTTDKGISDARKPIRNPAAPMFDNRNGTTRKRLRKARALPPMVSATRLPLRARPALTALP